MFKRIFSKNDSKNDNKNIVKNKEKKILEIEIEEDKIVNLDSKKEKLLFKSLKQKYVDQLESLIFAVENIKTSQLYESKVLEEMLEKKENMHIYFESLKSEYLDKCESNTNAICSVCMDNFVDTVFIPCGHLICNNCFKSFNDMSECFTCRAPIRNINHVYLN